MLFTTTTKAEALSTEGTRGFLAGDTQDAHRTFCDLFEAEDDGGVKFKHVPGAAADVAAKPDDSAHAAATASSTLGGGRGVNGVPTAVEPSFFKCAAASIRRGLIGRNTMFRTPYGMKPLVYSDWTATGRAVRSIEAYLADQVVPLFGNTHTTTSITGAQTTCFRHEARQIIAQAVNAKITGRAAEDVVLFTGTGATSAVAKLVSALGLAGPPPPGWKPDDRPVIFVGPFEHHSNLLPWRESCGEVVTIGENSSGGLDLAELEEQLRRFANRKLKIGSFCAASNVTGGLEDVDRVTATLHRAGALALWDYATAAPYVHVDMNPAAAGVEDDQALVAKDAIFFSGHKFVGGPGTPGVLVVKKRLLGNAVPAGAVGGGTVFFVTQDDHRYLSNKEEREEGGTPDILGSIRLGLAVQMKEQLGRQRLQEREEALAELGLATLRAHPRMVVLGDSGKKRLPIFSFLIRSRDNGRFLHYNFVCALLNDLFGVQSRGGCQCAGPYSQLLLGLSMEDTRKVEAELLRKHELLRPGFSRLSLSYVNSDEEAKYILDAVLFVADHGAAFLPYYRLNYKTGEWKHKTRFTRFPERRWLGNCDYGFPLKSSNAKPSSRLDAPATVASRPSGATPLERASAGKVGEDEQGTDGDTTAMAEGVFQDAAQHLRAAEAGTGEARWQGAEDVLGAEGEALRWFLYPWEGGRRGAVAAEADGRHAVAVDVNSSDDRGAITDGSARAGRNSGIGGSSSNGSTGVSTCIINPRVYGGAAVDGTAAAVAVVRVDAGAGASNTADSHGSGEDGRSSVGVSKGGGGGGAGVVPAAGSEGNVGEDTGNAMAESSTVDEMFPGTEAVAVEARGVETTEQRLPSSHDGGITSSPSSGASASSNGTGGTIVTAAAAEGAQTTSPSHSLTHSRGSGENSSEASPTATPTSRDTDNNRSNGSKSNNLAKPIKRQQEPDDSHKYPLRRANGNGREGTGFLLTAEDTPSFSATSTANGSSSSNGGGGGAGGSRTDAAAPTANGDAVNGAGEPKGYEGHMSALGKLAAGSAESRLFPTPGKKLMKAVGQAVQGWEMIEEGDRLCLGLSGGKDSMTLLHVLLHLKKRAPINFEVACATVDPQTASFDPSPLIPYLERLGVKLHYLSSPIIEQAKKSMQGDSLCAFCARMKRGLLYSCCREQGYNKLVLAQHLDDLAESFIMSALHNGQVRTMKANYKIEAGDVSVIRPLCYAREALMKDFARTSRLPVVNENCPACFEEPKERHRVKKMLAKEESLFPSMYANLKRALVPLMDGEAYVGLNKTSAEVAARQVERHSRAPTKRKTQATTRVKRDTVGDGAGASPALPGAGAATTEEGGSLAVETSSGPGDAQEGRPGDTLMRLAEFSDDLLERELARRRGAGGAITGGGRSVGDGSGGSGGDGGVGSAEDACGQDGGVCVPCFEIM